MRGTPLLGASSSSSSSSQRPWAPPAEAGPLTARALAHNKAAEALDAEGRRRFHGAFTGGFSAGYFNTVGSAEGWAPSTFHSSRAARAAPRAQRVEDFIDAEDDELMGGRLAASAAYGGVKREREGGGAPGPAPAPAAIPGAVPAELLLPAPANGGSAFWRVSLA
jgi:G patch domain-containing protein 1